MERVRTNWLQKTVAIIGSIALALSLVAGFAPANAWARVIVTAIPVISCNIDIHYAVPSVGENWPSKSSATATCTINGSPVTLSTRGGLGNISDETTNTGGDQAGKECLAHKYNLDFCFDINGGAYDSYTIPAGNVKLNGQAANVEQAKITYSNLSGTIVNRITISLTIDKTAPTNPTMTYPNGQTWVKGSTTPIIFKPISDFPFDGSLWNDDTGETVSFDAYDVKADGNIVTLKTSYLETLSVGKHNFSYLLFTGLGNPKWVKATATITIEEDANYKMTGGNGATWTKGSTTGLTFTSEAPFDKFSGIVVVDDKQVSTDMYEAVSGSTKVTLKPAFLSTLALGKHNISIVSDDGVAKGSFTIKAAGGKGGAAGGSITDDTTARAKASDPNKSPQTGVSESAPAATTAACTFGIVCALAITSFFIRKKLVK